MCSYPLHYPTVSLIFTHSFSMPYFGVSQASLQTLLYLFIYFIYLFMAWPNNSNSYEANILSTQKQLLWNVSSNFFCVSLLKGTEETFLKNWLDWVQGSKASEWTLWLYDINSYKMSTCLVQKKPAQTLCHGKSHPYTSQHAKLLPHFIWNTGRSKNLQFLLWLTSPLMHPL